MFFGDETVCETDISTDWFFVQIYRSQNKSMDLLFVFGCHWYVIPVIPQSSPSWGHFRRKDHLFQPREAHGFWGLSTHHWGGGAVEVWRSGRGSEDSKNLISKIPPCFWPRIMTKIAAPKWWDEISEASPECFQKIWELKVNIQIQACWWELTHSTKIVSSHLEIYQLSYSVSELVNTCKFVSPHATSSINDYTENETGIYCLWDGHVPTRQQWTAVEPC